MMSGFSGFEVRDSLDIGRYVIAKSEYKSGDLILDEEPLLISPLGMHAISTRAQNLSEDVTRSTYDCVGCFKTLFEDVHFCFNCDWPLCSKECVKESLHTKYECSLFAEKKIGVSPKAFAHIYIIRAILMSKDEKNITPWQNFDSLSSSFGLNQEDFLAKNTKDIEACTNYLNDRLQMNIDTSLVGQIIRTCSVNAFGMKGEDEFGNTYRAEAVYTIGCVFGHSCQPNAEWAILPSDYNGIKRWHLRVYARRNILSNDSINVSYLLDCLSLGTADRKRFLTDHFHFDCKCLRCSDPNEFSFYTEAVKCPSCGDERLTPDNPTDQSSTWTCNQCGVCQDYTFAQTCMSRFEASLELTMDTPSQSTLELFLTWSTESSGLSQNHREIILTMFYWIHSHSIEKFHEMSQHSTASSDIFVKFMGMATKCLKVFRMFGVITNIVELETSFARAIAAFYFKTVDFCSIRYDPYLPQEKLKIIKAICSHLSIAFDTMQWSPHNPFYKDLRQLLIAGYKFWEDELKALKAFISEDTCDVDINKYSIEFNEGRTISEVDEPKSCSNESGGGLTEDSAEESSCALLKANSTVSQLNVHHSLDELPSVVITSSSGYNLILMKPPVSLLTKVDFYFDG